MNKHDQIKAIKGYVKELFQHDESGHDFYHMQRVARLAKGIAVQEKADVFLCEAAAWLHDIGDYKLFKQPDNAIENMEQFLNSLSVSEKQVEIIHEMINDVSFSKGKVPNTLEGKIVQDADRLDAIGAIGIARTFAYGGSKGQLIHHDGRTDTSIQHFYDKLLTLKNRMNTVTAKEIALKRHQFMKEFLEQFYKEW
ncbi:HD domain-containing protein [Oceanobacillus salinisoli]|uniref:HD domain-containing protein n=1 Tax=Oceanobacillus salinisoli TaxID=2678611 RepID=UPI0012E2C29E|nr:HD domain-containing protein [Oceanobacillus salinisoli]